MFAPRKRTLFEVGSASESTVNLQVENLKSVLERAIGTRDKRLAIATLGALFKLDRLPSLALFHQAVGVLWGRSDILEFLRSMTTLVSSDWNAKRRVGAYVQNVTLTHVVHMLRQGRIADARELMESTHLHDDSLRNNPLLLTYAGFACFLLWASNDSSIDDTDQAMNDAKRHFTSALTLAHWHGLDECAFLLASLHYHNGEIAQAKTVICDYATNNPKSIGAARMKAEFLAQHCQDDTQQSLFDAHVSLAALDPSSSYAYCYVFSHIDKVKISARTISGIALARLMYCSADSWEPWANLVALHRSGALNSSTPPWKTTFWRRVHFSPLPDRCADSCDVRLAVAKAAFADALFPTGDSFRAWWISFAEGLSTRDDFSELAAVVTRVMGRKIAAIDE